MREYENEKEDLDLWCINPRDRDFQEPAMYKTDLNNLDVESDQTLSRPEIEAYFASIEKKLGPIFLV